MPPKYRVGNDENDENAAGSTRLTRARAKTAALNAADDLSQPSKPLQPSKALQNKKSGVNAATQGGGRKRAALGDVSNVTKIDAAEGKKTGASSSKVGLVSKAAQPSRVQKSTTASTRRAPLASKEPIKKPLKRSGPGEVAGKRAGSSSAPSTIKEETPAEDGEPVRKKVHTLDKENERRKGAEEVVAKTAKTVKTVKTVKAIVKPELEPEEETVDKSWELLEQFEKVERFQELEEVVEDEATETTQEWIDLDQEDLDDPLMVAEYASEIFSYLRNLERESLPNSTYMEHQDELEWKTRGILIDWLIEVHTRFHLLPETLFLAVNIIDRFLTEKIVQLDRLQLVGVTAMFIASKYEEVLSPHVGNFRHVADDGFSESEILSAERFILSTLNYDLNYPNPMNFLRRISKADNYDIQSRTIGKYLMEISLLDHRFMVYPPSRVAAAAMFLSRLILDRGDWDPTLSHYAGYTQKEIEPVFKLMVDYLARPVVHEAFFKKYASKKFLKASILTRQWAKKNGAHLGIKPDVMVTSLDQIGSEDQIQ